MLTLQSCEDDLKCEMDHVDRSITQYIKVSCELDLVHIKRESKDSYLRTAKPKFKPDANLKIDFNY